ncbi:uncharacterized protein EV154DRAFT_547430 [Mucor mucedo]|uniref:uncharacterized protein n=1 Tax=Mucor mucedo TaxID=29922 RepID=UPI00221FD27C|nr:uncharacterized protein EV154DRAFT_547430 [Mucor mucedo]KAI7896434.1 hypothetical protein EV154DRAFT_547430 [Mucor mucedo]
MIWSIYCYISRDSRMLPVSIGGCLASMVLIGPVNSKRKKYYGVKGRYIMVKRRIKWNLVATRSGINTQHAEETRNTRWWYNFGVLPHPVVNEPQFRNIRWYKMDVFTTKCCGFLPHVAGFYHPVRHCVYSRSLRYIYNSLLPVTFSRFTRAINSFV